jgi:inhibitor of KinA sporulation pathway (predicted exonuclease)
MNRSNSIIIVDIEATCWDGTIPEGQQSEVIEIGVCLLNKATGQITANDGILVKPEHSTVSPFCTSLTTITRELLDKEGIPFGQACRQLYDLYGSQTDTWASYGAYDLYMMKTQCKERRIPYPLPDNHINVKNYFGKKKRLKRNTGMAGALTMLGLPIEGTHHRGCDDARNIARIMHWCLTN